MTQKKVFIKTTEVPWEDFFAGVQRKILGYDEHLMMTHIRFRKGAVGPLHKHPHTQVTFIEHGSFEVQIEGKKQILTAGDCYFVPSNVEHGVEALEESSLIDVFAPMREDFIKS